MIETVMVFALGFLVASLCTLLVLPAVNARAARLARRRTEAMLPLSVSEISAEKDFLRAEFAVRQRRLERAAEAARAGRHADMAALGSRTMEIARLTRDVAARDGEIATGQEARARLASDLDAARGEGADSLATLRALEEAHADLLDSLLAARAAQAPLVADTPPEVADREAVAALSPVVAEVGQHDSVERENADLRHRITELADILTKGKSAGSERLPAVGDYALGRGAH